MLGDMCLPDRTKAQTQRRETQKKCMPQGELMEDANQGHARVIVSRGHTLFWAKRRFRTGALFDIIGFPKLQSTHKFKEITK